MASWESRGRGCPGEDGDTGASGRQRAEHVLVGPPQVPWAWTVALFRKIVVKYT